MSEHPVDMAMNLAREWERRAKDAESQNQALQEALAKIAAAQDFGLQPDATGEAKAYHRALVEVRSIAQRALSPTQETDPG